MIRDVGSLDALKTVISQVAKNIGINSSQPVTIEVLDKLDLTKYLIKLGDKTLEALSQKELTLNAKYWAEVKTEDSGLVKLLNLAKKPEILQGGVSQNGSTLANVLDFEKLKTAVSEYVQAQPKSDEGGKPAQPVSSTEPKENASVQKDIPQKVKDDVLSTKAEVESKLNAAKTDKKDETPKADAQIKNDNKNSSEAAQAETKQQRVMENQAQKQDKILDAQKQLDLPESKQTNTTTIQAKTPTNKPEEPKISEQSHKKELERASVEMQAQKEEVKNEPQKTIETAKNEEPKEKKTDNLPPKQDVKKEEVSTKSEQISKKEQTQTASQPKSDGIKESKELPQKQELAKNEQKPAQATLKSEEKLPTRQSESQSVVKRDGTDSAKEPQREIAKQPKDTDSTETKRSQEQSGLESLKTEIASGEITHDEIQALLQRTVEAAGQESEVTDKLEGQDDVADKQDAANEHQNSLAKESVDATVKPDESPIDKPEITASEVTVKKDSVESKETPSSKIKSEVLKEMSKTESKEQFQIMSNLALNLNRNGFTMFVKGEDGKDGVLQFRKKAGGVLTPKTVEFYSAFEHLGPIAGEISQFGDQTYLSMEVEFESTMKALASTMSQLEFFDKKNVSVRHGIKQLFDLKSSLLNLVG